MAGEQNKSDDWVIPSASEPVKNIVLVGRTGNGKSATGNSLTGTKVFESKFQAVGVTQECQTFRVPTSDGPIINVIDTPGLFDLAVSAEFISKEIVRCLLLAREGLHAVVLVLSLRNRISQEEENTLKTLQIMFGSEIIDYLIVLFTNGDCLEENDQTLNNYLSKGCPDFLKDVLKLCGGRKVVFDNKTTDEGKKAKQVQELLVHVATIEKETRRNPYTDTMHRKIQEEAERKRTKEKEIDEKNIAEAEKAELKKQLDLSYGQSMNMMAQLMERMFKDSAGASERQLNMMKDFMEMSLMGKERIRAQEKAQQAAEAAEAAKGCNIL